MKCGGTSSRVTRMFGGETPSSLHSEHVALKKIPYNILCNRRKMAKIEVYNVRFTRDGKLTMSCCCTNCATMLHTAGIKKIFYTNEEGNFIKDTTENIKEYAKKSRGTRAFDRKTRSWT